MVVGEGVVFARGIFHAHRVLAGGDIAILVLAAIGMALQEVDVAAIGFEGHVDGGGNLRHAAAEDGFAALVRGVAEA